MRFQAILLALGLLLVSSDVVPSSARAAGCKQENVKKFFKKTDKWCSTEYAKNISAMTDQNILVRKGASAATLGLAKHTGGYYLVLWTTTRGQGDHTVRAEQDPLMFKFDDGTELALQVDTDTSSRRIGMGTSEGFCGFYNITKEQLQSVGTKKVVEVVKFFDPEKEKSGPRLEQTEDGRTFYRWALTLKKNQEELADQAACVLTF
ncbi:MAG: hypothetical protein JRD94_06770 [Deltaproteobacteria bacterium]|nr:hypothetical protein [Deltaproteobacteria bacterium]